MLKEERQDKILHKLSSGGKVVASKLALELDVSEDTIRRDLLELDQRGLLKRVYGGALPITRPLVDYLDRENRNLEMKQRMAEKTLRFLKKDQMIAVDGSSANLQFVHSIPKDLQLTLITNSFPIAQACTGKQINVISIGGELLRETMTTVGDVAVEQARLYHPDLCFVGVYGVHPEYGLTIPYQAEVGIKRQLIQSSSKVFSFINPDKFNTVSKYFVCGMEAFTTLVTDDSVPIETLSAYQDLGLDCI